MKFAVSSLIVAAACVSHVAADFQIYYEAQVIVNPEGDETTANNIRVFDGPPSCDDVNLNYAGLGVAGDASHSGYARCDGCGDYGDIANWVINALEMNAANDWGHYTIYEPDYQVTPADGGDLQGSCVRDNGDDYGCTTGLDETKGNRLFICTSPKNGIHAK